MANMAHFNLLVTVEESEIEALKGFTAGLIKDHFAALVPVTEFAGGDGREKLWGCWGAFNETLTWEECKLDYSGQCKWSPPIFWAQAIAKAHPAWHIKFEFASWESGYRGSIVWDGQKWTEEFVDHICMACGRVNCQDPCPAILTPRQVAERNLREGNTFGIPDEQWEREKAGYLATLAKENE